MRPRSYHLSMIQQHPCSICGGKKKKKKKISDLNDIEELAWEMELLVNLLNKIYTLNGIGEGEDTICWPVNRSRRCHVKTFNGLW